MLKEQSIKPTKTMKTKEKNLGSNHSLMVLVRRKKGKITTAISMMENNQQLLNEVYIQKT